MPDTPPAAHPGSFCTLGDTGVSTTGTPMVCTPGPDGGRARWRRDPAAPPRKRPPRKRGPRKPHAATLVGQGTLPAAPQPQPVPLPWRLTKGLRPGEVGTLHQGAGLPWNGPSKMRDTQRHRLITAGLLDEQGRTTGLGLEALRRAGHTTTPAVPEPAAHPVPAPVDRSADAGTDWGRYAGCDTCYAPPGNPCFDLGRGDGSTNATPHPGRRINMTAPDTASAPDRWWINNGLFAATITDKYGRVWTTAGGDLVKHDCLVFPVDMIPGLALPSPKLASNPNYVGKLCGICRSEWPADTPGVDPKVAALYELGQDLKPRNAREHCTGCGEEIIGMNRSDRTGDDMCRDCRIASDSADAQFAGYGPGHEVLKRCPQHPHRSAVDCTDHDDTPPADATADEQVAADVEAAYRRIAGDAGRRANLESAVGPIAGGGYVPISAIRRELGDQYSREQVDRALDRMIEDPNVQLQESLLGDYLLPDHVRSGAVTIGDQPRHIIKIDRSGDSGTDWARYAGCDTCYAPPGNPCFDLGRGDGSTNATPHPGRPVAAEEEDPYVMMRRLDAAADRRLANELDDAAERGDLTTHKPDEACEYGLWHTGPCAPPQGAGEAEQTAKEKTAEEKTAEDHVRDAYARLAPNPGDWVSLADLRDNLPPDLPRDQVDEALTAMAENRSTDLTPEMNQRALEPGDRAAAVNYGGQDAHAMRIEPPFDQDAATRGAADPTTASDTDLEMAERDMSIRSAALDRVHAEQNARARRYALPLRQRLAGMSRADAAQALVRVPERQMRAVLDHAGVDQVRGGDLPRRVLDLTNPDPTAPPVPDRLPTSWGNAVVDQARAERARAVVDRSTTAGTDWGRYDPCGTCHTGAGQPCRAMDGTGDTNAVPHDGRPLNRHTVLREVPQEDTPQERMAAIANASKVDDAEHMPTMEEARKVLDEISGLNPVTRASMLHNMAVANERAGNHEVAALYWEEAKAPRREADRQLAEGFVANVGERLTPKTDGLPDWARQEVDAKAAGDRAGARQLARRYQRRFAATEQDLRSMSPDDQLSGYVPKDQQPTDRSADAGTDWSRYAGCPTCHAPAGHGCWDLARSGDTNATPHQGRPLAAMPAHNPTGARRTSTGCGATTFTFHHTYDPTTHTADADGYFDDEYCAKAADDPIHQPLT